MKVVFERSWRLQNRDWSARVELEFSIDDMDQFYAVLPAVGDCLAKRSHFASKIDDDEDGR